MSSNKVKIGELSNPEDLVEIIDFLPDQLKEIDFNGMQPDPQRMVESLYVALLRGKIWVAKKDDKLIGVLALTPQQFWWSSEYFLTDLSFYVSPEYRRSKLGAKLLQLAIEYAKIEGLKLIISLFTTTDLKRKEDFFLRMGFTKVGGEFVMDNKG